MTEYIKANGMISRSPRSRHCRHVAKINQLILFDLKKQYTKIIWQNGAAKCKKSKDIAYETLKKNNWKGSIKRTERD